MTTADSQSLAGPLLVEHQRLATSGARAVLPFRMDSQLRLAIPQLAVDIPGTPPYMNGGDSDIDMLLYRWSGGRFIEARHFFVRTGRAPPWQSPPTWQEQPPTEIAGPIPVLRRPGSPRPAGR